MPLLDPARLPRLLGEEAAFFDVESIACVDSSNKELGRRLVTSGIPSGTVLVADQQTAGKGRQGRIWASEPSACLTFSLYWRFSLPASRMCGLSLVVGLAVHRALLSLGARQIALKWPNDILRADDDGGGWRKLGGILIQIESGRQDHTDTIIGIGLNLSPFAVPVHPQALPPGFLSEVMAQPPERHEVLAAILKALRRLLADFARTGLQGLSAEWEAAHAWQNQRLTAQGLHDAQGVPLVGRCVGLNLQGELLLETPEGLRTVVAGDVSLRMHPADHVLPKTTDSEPLLCLDAGNTRLKWGVVQGSKYLGRGCCEYAQLPTLSLELQAWPSLRRGGLACVAGEEVALAIRSELDKAFPALSLSRLESLPAALGVRNLYANPETLGVDRWCALVAARQRCLSLSCLVVSLGTATTIDALAADGRFLGGLILPGITLMRRSLSEQTARLPLVSDANNMGDKVPTWPVDTEAAILRGSLEATLGAIERAWQRLAAETDSSPSCLLTGGAVDSLADRLSLPIHQVNIVPDLVLEGIRLLVREA